MHSVEFRTTAVVSPLHEGKNMYGIVVELEIDEQQADRATDFLHQVAVPMIKQAPGSRAGRGCVHVTVSARGA